MKPALKAGFSMIKCSRRRSKRNLWQSVKKKTLTIKKESVVTGLSIVRALIKLLKEFL